MRKTLICSHDPILIKNIYGLFIDGGFTVEIVDHVSLAIKRVMGGDIGLLVMDAATFGLSVKEAIEIIKNVVPEMPYIVVGPRDLERDFHGSPQNGSMLSNWAHDLEGIRTILRAIKEPETSIKGVKNDA